MRRAALVLALASLASLARADVAGPIGATPGMMSSGPGMGISGSTLHGAGIPVVPCNAGALDFTDGCGTTQLMVILK